MPEPGQTSTGAKTLATIGDMPKHPEEVPKVVTYWTSLGAKTVDEIKKLLTSGELHVSHLGDDVIKLLGLAKQEVATVAGKVASAWGAKK